MALLLAFDTATRHLAVVLSEDARPIATRVDRSGEYSHAEKLNVFIDEVLREAGLTAKQLDAIAVGLGPGSYTGLRIGSSAAQGLSFGLDRPLIGMGTLEVLVHELLASGVSVGPNDHLLPMVDARRMEVFTRAFDVRGQALTEASPVVLDKAWCAQRAETAERTVVFGDGADKAADLWTGHGEMGRFVHVPDVRPDVKGLASCAARYWSAGTFVDRAYLVPMYGKEAAAKVPGR